ncbi:outer membrane protein [Aminobacter sp. HY435]|uniref:outer membrane protein n=1 Tax=Aminobacter sp. HY435 TaxID=2970917 RepID=UPI0022B95788|nr:outer membrane protein [Aminobacter sp. HY435]
MRTLLATTVLLGLAGTAGAADAVVYDQAVSSAYNWSGIYVGAAIGYAWGDSPFENRTGDYVQRTDYDPDGVLGGVYVGYNHQFANNVVLGIDADINAAHLTGGGGEYSDNDGPLVGLDTSSKMNWNGAVRARAGYAMDRFLPYVAGGLSFGGYEFELLGDNVLMFSEKETMVGWNIGAGIEYAATDNLILRAEYRYSDFGSKDYAELRGEEAGKIKLRTHDIRLGLAYKF